MTVGIYTLGCRVNQYESEAIAEALGARGIIVCDAGQVCDAYIINTCTVTAESARKARQFIRRARDENPAAFILVTGCYAQTEAERIAQIDGVDYICGSSNKMSCVTALEALRNAGKKNTAPEICIPDGHTADFEQMSISSFSRTRAYLKIEDGCENKCAYCIIPRARGRVRSKPEDEVLAEVRNLAASGYREIVLTGIETAAYGADLPGTDLITLIQKIDRIDGIERIRLGSLDPSFAGERFAALAAQSAHLCPHFHLSLQSGCDATLAAMRRKYNTAQAARNIERLRTVLPDACFSADIIVGFPGESDAQFTETCDFVTGLRLLHAHVFPYSRRQGTEAADLPCQIPEGIKKARAKHLIERCEQSSRAVVDGFAGRRFPVLFEQWDGEYAYGHTENFIEVAVKTDRNLHALTAPVEIIGAQGKKVLAKLAEM